MNTKRRISSSKSLDEVEFVGCRKKFKLSSNLTEQQLCESPDSMDTKYYEKLSIAFNKYCSTHMRSESTRSEIMDYQRTFYPILQRYFPEMSIYMTGSTATGIATKNSDVDLVVITDPKYLDSDPLNTVTGRKLYKNSGIDKLYEIRRALRHKDDINNVQVIKAVVPVLKFYNSKLRIQFDLTVDVNCGIKSTCLLILCNSLNSRMKSLFATVKRWASLQGINDAPTGTLSSYSLVILVLYFAQNVCYPPLLPNVFQIYISKLSTSPTSREMVKLAYQDHKSDWRSENQESLGELFCQFVKYYSTFNWSKYGVNLRSGAVKLRVDVTKHLIFIEEPFDMSNTARAVQNQYCLNKIIRAFQKTSTSIRESRMDFF